MSVDKALRLIRSTQVQSLRADICKPYLYKWVAVGRRHSTFGEGRGEAVVRLLQAIDRVGRTSMTSKQFLEALIGITSSGGQRQPRSPAAMSVAWRRWTSGQNFPALTELAAVLEFAKRRNWLKGAIDQADKAVLAPLLRELSKLDRPPREERGRPLGIHQPMSRQDRDKLESKLLFTKKAVDAVMAELSRVPRSETGAIRDPNMAFRPQPASEQLAIFRAAMTLVACGIFEAIERIPGSGDPRRPIASSSSFASDPYWPTTLRGTADDLCRLFYRAARAIDSGEGVGGVTSVARSAILAHPETREFDEYLSEPPRTP